MELSDSIDKEGHYSVENLGWVMSGIGTGQDWSRSGRRSGVGKQATIHTHAHHSSQLFFHDTIYVTQ